MAAIQLVTFEDLIDALCEELGIQSSDTTTINRLKRMVNMVYINEVVPTKRWKWLEGHTKVVHKAYYQATTASVTTNSATVTLTDAPAVGQGSFANYKFSVEGFDEIYDISAHTAGSATVTLSSTYQGDTDSAVSYKIWKETVDLPTDLRETTEVWHNRHKKNMEGVGSQELRKISAESPKAEGFPVYYYTGDFFDPSGGDETESDRYRQLRIYPAINNESVTIHIDYVKEVTALEDDADEPLMPIGDRVVLFYGALAQAWPALRRNPEEGNRNFQLYSKKLAAMAGTVEDSFDTPTLAPKGRYLSRIRRQGLGNGFRDFSSAGGSSSTPSNITYVTGITIDGGNITDNITAAAGVTIDGRDISADGTTNDAHIAATAAHGATGAVVGTTNTQTLTNKTIVAASNTITTASSGNLTSTDLNSALAELQTDIDTRATSAALTTHTGASSGVHGVTGSVVGTTDTQTLTNKTLTSPVINTPTGIVKGDVGLGNVDNTSDTTKNAAAVALTNKTIVVSSNTVTTASSGNLAATELNTALAELQTDIDTRLVSPMSTGGDIIYGGASGVATRLANGSLNQVLTSGGGTAAPTWTTLVKNCGARITYSAGTPSVVSEIGGDWISSLTDTGTGQIGINLTASFFGVAPIAVGSSEEAVASGSSVMITSTSTSSITVRVRDLASTLIDENIYVIAIGN